MNDGKRSPGAGKIRRGRIALVMFTCVGFMNEYVPRMYWNIDSASVKPACGLHSVQR